MSTLWRGWTVSIGYYRILNDYFNIVNKSQLEHQPWELPSTTSGVRISGQAFQPEPARTTPGLGVHLRTHANPFLLPQLEVSPERDKSHSQAGSLRQARKPYRELWQGWGTQRGGSSALGWGIKIAQAHMWKSAWTLDLFVKIVCLYHSCILDIHQRFRCLCGVRHCTYTLLDQGCYYQLFVSTPTSDQIMSAHLLQSKVWASRRGKWWILSQSIHLASSTLL